ncbi:hypothetical protein JNUCC64_16535 [Streptomyces sp. JNUCC 64]
MTLGAAATSAQAVPQSAVPSVRAASHVTVGGYGSTASQQAFVRYLDSVPGQRLIRDSRLSPAQVTALYSGNDIGSQGWLDRIRKRALKSAFNSLPESWKKKLTNWAREGKSYFLAKWNTLPGWVKKTLTLGGVLSVRTVVEWLIEIIL